MVFPLSLFVTVVFFLEGLLSLLSCGVETVFLLGVDDAIVESWRVVAFTTVSLTGSNCILVKIN